MSRFGLVGPSYASQSPNLDAEACINLYVESDDGGAGNAPLAMYPTPGTKVFANLNIGSGGGGTAPGLDQVVQAAQTGSPTSLAYGPFHPASPNEIVIASIMTNTVLSINPNGTQVGVAGYMWSSLLTVNPTTYTANFGSGTPSAIVAASFFGTALAISQTGTSATLTKSFVNPVPAGHTIVVALAVSTIQTSPGTYTVTDDKGNVYTQLGLQNVVSGVNFGQAGLWVCQNPHGGPQAITITKNTGGVIFSSQMSIADVSGLALNPPANGPVRGELFINGRAFAVSGGVFFELFANGTFTNWGAVANDSLPVTMAASPQQLLLASAGTAYVFDLMANTLTAIPGATFSGPVAQAAICDDFFILTIQNSKEFVVSAPLDATDWVTNGSAIVSVFPDNIVSMLVFQRQVWFFSDTQSVVYYDSGNLFPFDVNPNAFIEAGSAAENSPAIFNNSIAWLGADARGRGKVWLASGYTPTRISNHAIEFAIQSYSRIDDAVSFSYQDQGHEFLCIYFPTPSVMWVYDALTGMWHQQGFWVESIGQFRAAHRQNHMFAFGKHLVGDWQSGNVYWMNIPVSNGAGGWSFADDVGNPIRRVRRAPHVSREQKNQFHIELQIYVEAGLGPQPPLLDGAGKARDPQLMLSWSDDGGHTFGNEFALNCGQAGNFRRRARKLQLGRTRDRVYQIAMSDPIPWRIVDGYLQVVQGTGI